MTSLSGKQPCLLRQHHGQPGWVPLRKALWASPNITSADGTIRNRLAFLLDLAAQDTSPLPPFSAKSETCIPCPPSTLELHFLGAFPTALRVWACHMQIAITLHPTTRSSRVSQVRTGTSFRPRNPHAANAGQPQAPHHRQPHPPAFATSPIPHHQGSSWQNQSATWHAHE